VTYGIMTFNLRYWNQEDGEHSWPNRRDSVARLIAEKNPLVVGTQEGLYPMLCDLDARLPSYERIGQGREGAQDGEFCAIYYRKDLMDVKAHGQFWLSETPDVVGSMSWDTSLPRICTWALLEGRVYARRFMVFNTHLDHRGQEAREKGAELIWSVMSKHILVDRLPCILMGDMNCTPENRVIQFLRTHLVDTLASQGQDTKGTFHGFRGSTEGRQPIDYIFCSSDIKVTSAQIVDETIDGVYPSDHYPVLANMTF